MNIVLGVDDFRRPVQLAKKQGKWRAWRKYYYESYRQVFEPVEGRPEKIAYYVGARMVGDLLNRGHDICQLTRTPTDDIVALWDSEQAA